jgi:ERCC4-type nuclease
MIIKVDVREQELLTKIKQLVLFVPIFKKLEIVSENLSIGDFIITDGKEEKLIIERKSINDLLASIKDGRYEEQSYRLNGAPIHNHNIIYLIEGDVNKPNRFKNDNHTEKLTAYSAMFSLNYYKGFSVFRTFNMDETATVICNMAYKLEKNDKKGFYTNIVTINDNKEEPEISNNCDKEDNEDKEDKEDKEDIEKTDKDYISVIKKVKKDNITADNIDEIMLCQIPGISAVTSMAIIEKFKSLSNLLKEIENNQECLKDISYTNNKGQTRKINKTCSGNIIKYLLKK